MKNLFRFVVLFMITFMTLAFGGGIAFCEPLVLTKGINIKFVFAGLDFMYARGTFYGAYMPDVMYGEFVDTNGVTQCRMKNVLGIAPNPILNDFYELRLDGFDFARLMVEPFALGATPANPAVNPNSPGYRALVQTIEEAAVVQGMKLDIAMFPDAFSYTKYRDHWAGALNPPPPPNVAPPSPWPGLYGHQLCWRDDDPASFQVPANHPLRVFWTSLVQELKSSFPDNGSEPNPKFAILAFDICDEPLGVISPNMDPPDSTVPQYYPETLSWRNRWTNAGKNWRKLQLNAVQGIQSVVPNATILVSTYDAFPESYYSDPKHKIPDPEKYPIQTTKYAASECGVTNLIYKVHIFEPFRYTHSKDQVPQWVGGYNESRDFFGLDDNPNDPYPVPASWDQYHPLLGQIQEAMSWILNWRMSQRNVKMIVTGFGVNEVHRPNDFPDPLIEGEPIWESTPDKATWLHDVRKALETNNIGWAAYEYLGGFATHYGKWNPNFAHQYHLRDAADRSMIGAYQDALFQ